MKSAEEAEPEAAISVRIFNVISIFEEAEESRMS